MMEPSTWGEEQCVGQLGVRKLVLGRLGERNHHPMGSNIIEISLGSIVFCRLEVLLSWRDSSCPVNALISSAGGHWTWVMGSCEPAHAILSWGHGHLG